MNKEKTICKIQIKQIKHSCFSKKHIPPYGPCLLYTSDAADE